VNVAGERDVIEAVTDVEVRHGRAEDVTGVVERELDVRRDVGDVAVLEGMQCLIASRTCSLS